MKATYDKQVDAAYFPITKRWEIESTKSYDFENGVIVNLDIHNGEHWEQPVIVGIEILGVKKIIK